MKPAALVAGLLFAVAGIAYGSSGPALRMEPVDTDPRDVASLQRGARLFVNYCLNCHSAKYVRYNRLTDLGLTEAQISGNLVLTGSFLETAEGVRVVPTKLGETMQVAMRASDAKDWLNAAPPDLSVESRVRGPQWLYNYLLGFYRDDRSVTGWNNLVFPNVGMPHALWELSGTNKLVTTEFPTAHAAEGEAIANKAIALVEPTRDGKFLLKTLAIDTPGSMTSAEYRQASADLVNFLDYLGEPTKLKRERIGLVVLLFLGVLFVFVYWLKREYWKELH